MYKHYIDNMSWASWNLIKEYAGDDIEFKEWLLDVESICLNRWGGSIWDLPRVINWYGLYATGFTPSRAVYKVMDEHELKGGY